MAFVQKESRREKSNSSPGHVNESFSMIARHEKKGGPVSRGSALCGVAEQVAAVAVLNRLRMNGKKRL